MGERHLQLIMHLHHEDRRKPNTSSLRRTYRRRGRTVWITSPPDSHLGMNIKAGIPLPSSSTMMNYLPGVTFIVLQCRNQLRRYCINNFINQMLSPFEPIASMYIPGLFGLPQTAFQAPVSGPHHTDHLFSSKLMLHPYIICARNFLTVFIMCLYHVHSYCLPYTLYLITQNKKFKPFVFDI